ncbi:flagellar hook assembly protein FlgD [Cellulomonas carbonis]|uniref:Flagellar hook capping protein n=1 Tax=Cellulomonas carbonis T26 TaxID=947969 RepID=A0A0A0BLL0_9CELL|nr:flagellar hook capping FlgD N-terminal domain-containing protein [Cellulomonas carbonis]KGM08846.1 flagellar hook capping protein [Cellulomonas carbonis T26]MDT0165139.1 flagellar hook capping FlgD N-terminal domain-containing protein [Actinotalea sp. AC32]GGC01627.1 hypothetical protein GCM10010972_13060 [Cellulomonas carbonis]
MTIDSTAATTPTSLYTTTKPATEAKKTMDSEVFLSLLVAQLRYQDPTQPMDTSDMMNQSTQLASMEQLTSVASTTRESFALQMRVAALGLIGQDVSFTDASGITRTGVAESVSFAGEVPMVTVGEWTIPLDQVAAARRTTTGTAPDGTTPSTTPGAGSSGSSAAGSGDTTPVEGTTPATGSADSSAV